MPVLANDKMRLIITGKCNLGCFYCHNEGQAKEDTFASIDDVRAVVGALVAGNVEVSEITVSGGEPLLHRDIEAVVSAAAEAASQVTIVSNGLLATPRTLRELAQRGLRKFRLGLDSLQPTKPRPSPGLLAEPFDVPHLLAAAADAGLQVDLNVVLTKFNRREVGDLAGFAVANHVAVKFFEHVEVTKHGGAGRGGAMMSAPHVTFDEFRDHIDERFGRTVPFRPDPQFGEANLTAQIGASEVRYCRYLCDYDLCWLTGTRVDARRYVYNCMSNRGLDLLTPGSAVEILDALSRATERSCRAGRHLGAVG